MPMITQIMKDGHPVTPNRVYFKRDGKRVRVIRKADGTKAIVFAKLRPTPREHLASHKLPHRRKQRFCQRKGCSVVLRKAQVGLCSDECLRLYLCEMALRWVTLANHIDARWPGIKLVKRMQYPMPTSLAELQHIVTGLLPPERAEA